MSIWEEFLKSINNIKTASLIKNNKYTFDQNGKIGSTDNNDYNAFTGNLTNPSQLYDDFKQRENTIGGLQTALNSLGVTDSQNNPLKVDKFFGAKTQSAWDKFAQSKLPQQGNALKAIADFTKGLDTTLKTNQLQTTNNKTDNSIFKINRDSELQGQNGSFANKGFDKLTEENKPSFDIADIKTLYEQNNNNDNYLNGNSTKALNLNSVISQPANDSTKVDAVKFSSDNLKVVKNNNLNLTDTSPKPQEQDNIAEHEFGNVKVWANDTTLQGVGILPNGKMVIGKNTSDDRINLIKMLQEQENNKDSEYDDYYKAQIGMLTRKIANNMKFDTKGQELTEEQLRENYINKIGDINYYKIEDVTKQINDYIKELESNNSGFNPLSLIAYYNQVKTGGVADVKNKKPYKYKNLFIYNGEIVDRDALGNIIAGYLGKCLGYDDEFLNWGAGQYQIISDRGKNEDWKSSDYDDPRDQVRTKQGMDIYRKNHK